MNHGENTALPDIQDDFAATRLQEITRERVLAVEGVADKRLFLRLLGRLELLPSVQVIPYDGKEKLRRFLKALVNTPGFDSVKTFAVARDANSDSSAAFESVAASFAAIGLAIPRVPCEVTAGVPRTAVIIIPPGEAGGMLEDLCLGSVRDDTSMMCVEVFFKCLADQKVAIGYAPKAKLHAFLAAKPKPGLRLGEAADAGYWPFDADAFHPLRDCLLAIFA